MERKISGSVCLLVAILILDLSTKVEAKQNDKRRKDKSNLSASLYPHNNICNINNRDSQVHCYCESAKSTNNASKAECWVFNGGISDDDPLWSNFATQPNLRELSFNVRADGGLSFVPTKALNYLRRLVNFIIKYASIHEISAYAFANISTVREITLSGNDIVHLKPYAFYHLTNLTVLTLDDNRITELVRKAFYDLPFLHKLYLTNNNISVVHDGAFRNLVNLIDLEMDNNSITALNRNSFQGLDNLKRLDLRNNKLGVLVDFTFAELWSLHELLLDSNELYTISERAFDGLTQLRMLSLSENKLVSLVSGLFEGVRGLTHIDLHSNNMHYLTYANMKPVLDNLKNISSFFNIEGNALVCDCRLLWIYRLRNDTKSDTIKTSLRRVTCVMDPTLLKQLSFDPLSRPSDGINNLQQPYENKPYEILNENVMNERHTKDMYFGGEELGGFEKSVGDVMYEDKILESDQQDSASNYDNLGHKDREKNFFDIPLEILPCPKYLADPTESIPWHPNQGEIKDYRNLNSASQKHLPFKMFGFLNLFLILITIS